MDFVTVFSTLNPAEAELIRARLELADFDVSIKNEDSAKAWGGGITSGGLYVQVPEEQAVDAKALLDSPEEASTGASA
ncbi:MAG: putative signal transducing protein [Limisphaerales bacterium]